MNATGPIILIEDDPDDVEIIRSAIQSLEFPNPVVVFEDGTRAIPFLSDPKVDPLMVISDVNLPRQHGVDLYKQLTTDATFVAKRLPYVFLSTSPEHRSRASEVNGCGYFVKPRNYFDYLSLVQRIVLYWKSAIPA